MDPAFQKLLDHAISRTRVKVARFSLDVENVAFWLTLRQWNVINVPSLALFIGGKLAGVYQNLSTVEQLIAILERTFPIESADEGTVFLYRPTGPTELELVRDSGWRRWPARLPEQPIFYPVENEQYASEIASRWNVAESGMGFVTRFRVKRSFIEAYQLHQVGASHHLEWWIPAEDLENLNDNIVGTIEVVAEFP